MAGAHDHEGVGARGSLGYEDDVYSCHGGADEATAGAKGYGGPLAGEVGVEAPYGHNRRGSYSGGVVELKVAEQNNQNYLLEIWNGFNLKT